MYKRQLKTTQTENNEKPNIIGYTFTNERYIGSIEITKALAGTGSDKEMCIRDRAYIVEETDERAQGYNIDASAYTSGGSGMIATDKEARVELKNVRNAGSLAIRKKIEGKDPISEREFSFTAAITYPAGVDLSDADNLPKIPMGSPMTVENRTVTIQDIRIAVSQTEPDVSVTIDNILYGASYTVTENDGFAEWGYAAYYDEDMKFGASTPNRVVNRHADVGFRLRNSDQM